jgi:hypothetical protein
MEDFECALNYVMNVIFYYFNIVPKYMNFAIFSKDVLAIFKKQLHCVNKT